MRNEGMSNSAVTELEDGKLSHRTEAFLCFIR